jgi:hypothetical protein
MNHLVIQYLKDRKRFEKSHWLPSLSLGCRRSPS